MRKLRLTETEINTKLEEIKAELMKGSLSNVKLDVKFDETKAKDDEKCRVVYRPKAFLKTLMLVTDFNSEVAWHYIVKRGANEREFIVEDCLVYPQEVTGVTVDMDMSRYPQWLIGLDDETASNMRGQGHSHVNMGVSPSGTDIDHQEKVVNDMLSFKSDDDKYYMFCIVNKKMQIRHKVYDIKNNVIYNDDDVSYFVYDEDCDYAAFVNDAEDIVQELKTSTMTWRYPYHTTTSSSKKTKGNSNGNGNGKGKGKNKNKSKSYYEYDYEDDKDFYGSQAWADYYLK